MNKSKVFAGYNVMVADPNLSATPELKARTHRALGLVQLMVPYHRVKYGTTLLSCGCPDRFYRQVDCKHMRAERLLAQAELF